MNAILLIATIAINPLELPRKIASRGPVDSAILVLDHIIDSARGTPLEARALLLKARIYRQIGDDGRAYTVLNGMRQMELPDDVADTAYFMLSQLTDELLKRASFLSEFIRKYPFAKRRRTALIELAELFDSLGMPDSAMMALKRLSADYKTGRDTVQVKIAEFRYRIGNTERAILLSRRHLSKIPFAHYVIAQSYLALGDTGLAVSLGLSENGKCPECLATEMELLNGLRASDIALKLADSSKLPISSWPPPMIREWAIAMINLGNADSVLHIPDTLLSRSGLPHPYKALLTFRFYILSQQFSSAISMIDSLPAVPPFTGYMIRFANRLIDMGYPHEALPILELIYSNGLHYPMDELLTALHRCYIKLDNYEKAADIEGEMLRFGVPLDTLVIEKLRRQEDAFKRLFIATGDSTFLRNATKLDSLLSNLPVDTATEKIRAMIENGQLDEAFHTVDLDRYDLLFEIAKNFLEQGDTTQAYAILTLIPIRGFKLDHDAFIIRLNLGYNSGKFQKVVEEFEDSRDVYIKFDADTGAWLPAGLSFIALGQYEKALKLLFPVKDGRATDGIALSLMQLGYPEIARQLKGLSNDMAVRCAIKSGDIGWLKSLKPPIDKKLLRKYLIAIAEHDPEYAMKLADSVGVSYVVKSELAVIQALKNGDLQTAMDNAATPLTHYMIGVFFMRHGMLDSARTYLKQALEEANMPLAAFKLGTIYYSLDIPLEAVKYYKIAMKDDSLRPFAIYNLASVYKTLRKGDSASHYYKLLMKEFGDREISLDAEDGLAFMLQSKGNNMEALNYWNDLEGELRKFEDEIELKYWKAEALFALNRSREALNYYLMVAHSNTSSQWKVISMLKAAKIYAVLGKKQKAVELYQKVIKISGPASEFSAIAQKELNTLKSE